jgi:hypothetical protein
MLLGQHSDLLLLLVRRHHSLPAAARMKRLVWRRRPHPCQLACCYQRAQVQAMSWCTKSRDQELLAPQRLPCLLSLLACNCLPAQQAPSLPGCLRPLALSEHLLVWMPVRFPSRCLLAQTHPPSQRRRTLA